MEELDTGYDTYAVIVSPGGEEKMIKMQPSRPGYYQGNFELDETGVYLIRVEQEREDGSSAAMEAGLIYPYSPEYDIRNTSSRNLSEHIAGQTGGRMLENPEDILLDELEPVWRYHEIWPALMLLALILFFIDIVLRKLGIRFVTEKMLAPPIRGLENVFVHLKGSYLRAKRDLPVKKDAFNNDLSEKNDQRKSSRKLGLGT